MKPEKIDSSMAEKWLDADTFIYKGKVYRYDWNNFTFKELSLDRHTAGKKGEIQ